MWPKVHVKTSQGDPARSNPRNHHKNAIKRSTTRTIAQGRKKKRQRKVKTQPPAGIKKKEKASPSHVPLMVRSYLTNGPSNVACMQITRSNNNGSNLVELVVIKIQEQTSDHYQVGSSLSDPVPTNAPSKNPVLDFLMGT